jgi:hypothetical protein
VHYFGRLIDFQAFSEQIFFSFQNAHVALAFQTGAANSEFRFPLLLMKSLMGNYHEGTVLGRNQGAKYAVVSLFYWFLLIFSLPPFQTCCSARL